MDKAKIREATRIFLEAIGENPEREGLLETPDRIARMAEELFSGIGEEAETVLSKRFDAPMSEFVMERDIVFHSMCEHHLLPFFGKVHIAYIPDGEVAGLSKLARTVEIYSHRLQLQENLTVQIAEALQRELHPKGVMVMAEAEHMCMSMRGVRKPGTVTVTTAIRGDFGASEQQRFLQMVRG